MPSIQKELGSNWKTDYFNLDIQEKENFLIAIYAAAGIDGQKAKERISELKQAPKDNLAALCGVGLEQADNAYQIMWENPRSGSILAKEKLLRDHGFNQAEVFAENFGNALYMSVEKAMVELAQLSKKTYGYGKPKLCSTYLAAALLGAENINESARFIGQFLRHNSIKGFLTPYSSCNAPKLANEDDLKRGIHYPQKNEQTAFLLGLIFTFGYENARQKLCFRLSDKTISEQIKIEMQRHFNLEPSEFQTQYNPRTVIINGVDVNFKNFSQFSIDYSSGLLKQFLKENGFPKKLKEIKQARIPEWIREGEMEFKLNFLRGIHKKTIYERKQSVLHYTNKSMNFMNDLTGILNAFEIKSSFCAKNNSCQFTISKNQIKKLENLLNINKISQ